MKRISSATKAVEQQSEVPASGVPVPADVPQRIEFLPVAKVSESKSNPRKSFGDMTELIESVRTKGVLVPVLCRPSADTWGTGVRRTSAPCGAGGGPA